MSDGAEITYDQVNAALFSEFPELRERVEVEFGNDYDLKNESPGAYLIFEDVVRNFVYELSDSSRNPALLSRILSFFEKMAISSDRNVTDLLRIAILEPLVYESNHYHLMRRYMGEKTLEYAHWEEHNRKQC